MSVTIIEYKPADYLQPFVQFFWEGNFNITLEPLLKQQVAPNGFVELIIHLTDDHCFLPAGNRWSRSPDYTIIGLYTRPYEVQFPCLVKTFGIRFKPEGIYNLFGIPASVFSENYEDMELVLGKEFSEYCSKLREASDTRHKLKITERYLLTQLKRNNRDLSYVNRAAEMIRRPNSLEKIDDLPGRVYISLRQLEREFKQKVGITPKQYHRITRLNDVYRRLEENQQVEFTKIAFDCGYADQAHFIRDFKSIMGVKPTIFIKEKQQYIVNSRLAESSAEDYR